MIYDYLNQNRHRPFDWATWNCGDSVSGWLALNGIEHGLSWSSEQEAMAHFKKMRSILRKLLGNHLPILQARTGDIALGERLGIVDGDVVWCPGDDGYIARPLTEFDRCYRV